MSTATSIIPDLKDDATNEDIMKAVDKIVESEEKLYKDRDEEDGKKDTEKTPAGDDDDSAERDDSASKKDGEEGDGEEGEAGQDWLDDDLRAEAAAMGIPDDQLSEYANREELDRAMRLLGTYTLAAGKGAKDDGKGDDKRGQQDDRPRGSDGRFHAKDHAKDDAKDDDSKAAGKPGDYEVKLDKDFYDDGLVEELNRLNDHYKSRLQKIEARYARLEEADRLRERKIEEERFDAAVDGLNHPDLFGESGKETKAQLKNRMLLLDDCRVFAAGRRSMGMDADVGDKALVSRMSKMTFSDQLYKQQRQELTRKVSKQSAMRTGSGSQKTSESKGKTIEEEMQELWNEMNRERG